MSTASTATEIDRAIPFERCFNVRDLGGYTGLNGRRVRRHTIYRGMTPEYMTERDLTIARGLGITTVIDLRGRRSVSSGPLGDPPARRVPLGNRRAFRPTVRALEEFRDAPPEVALPLVLERMAPGFKRAIPLIADSEGAVLIHCRLGKDRTGVLSALVLKLLGVDDADVVADYMASAPSSSDALRLVREAEGTAHLVHIPNEARVSREPPSVEGIEAVLRRLEQYGGAYAYFEQHGASRRTMDRLIAKLLKEPEA
jgi:protein-tyrosine phosphatase